MIFFASEKPFKFDFPTFDKNEEYSIKSNALSQMPEQKLDLSVVPKYNGVDPPFTDYHNPLNALQYTSASVHWKQMKVIFPLEYWMIY